METHVSYLYRTLYYVRLSWRDYLALTKPRVVSLLLLTTVASMLVVGNQAPPASVILLLLVGGYLAAGGAGALNCYLDRDIDGLMGRTRSRPLPAGRLQPHQAFYFGLALTVMAFLLLWLGVNLLTAALAMVGVIWYVGLYTYWLKRRSSYNIVVGGAAGAIPCLVGGAAVTGTVTLEALLLFAIVFLWTPPHFWALALVLKQDYSRAGVPMLPVIRSSRVTQRQIMLYIAATGLLTLTLPFFGLGSFIYFAGAYLLGGLFIFYAFRLIQDSNVQSAWRLFKYSMLYLALLFVALVIDHLIVG